MAELVEFRAELYECLSAWPDALFELADALCASPGRLASVPALSLEPAFRRSHGSLYKALARGDIDTDALRRALVRHRPAGWPLVFAVDRSTWARAEATTSPERGMCYLAGAKAARAPVVAGWSYQWVAQVSFVRDSWTAPLEVERLAPGTDVTAATAAAVVRICRLVPDDAEVPLFVFDSGYHAAGLTQALAAERVEILVRLRSNRCFYADPVPGPPSRGRPRRHGARLALADPGAGPVPDAVALHHDAHYGAVRVSAWHGLHPKLNSRAPTARGAARPPIIKGSVLRVEVERLPGAARPGVLWLWWAGAGLPDLEQCWQAYIRRFALEHTYRFVKTTLGWTTPALRMPAQADRWSWLVLAVLAQLRLARHAVGQARLPWERLVEPARQSPARVRRGFRLLGPLLGTPAHPPKSRMPGPGRPKGTQRPPRTRYPVIKQRADTASGV